MFRLHDWVSLKYEDCISEIWDGISRPKSWLHAGDFYLIHRQEDDPNYQSTILNWVNEDEIDFVQVEKIEVEKIELKRRGRLQRLLEIIRDNK